MGGFFDIIPGGDLLTAGAQLGSAWIQSSANKKINERNIAMQRETNSVNGSFTNSACGAVSDGIPDPEEPVEAGTEPEEDSNKAAGETPAIRAR